MVVMFGETALRCQEHIVIGGTTICVTNVYITKSPVFSQPSTIRFQLRLKNRQYNHSVNVYYLDESTLNYEILMAAHRIQP